MRVKQTARKSTATSQSQSQQSMRIGNSRLSGRSNPAGSSNSSISSASSTSGSERSRFPDPMETRMQNILHVKRQSAPVSKRTSGGKTLPQRSKTTGQEVKHKPRSKSGEMALKEIKRLQQSTSLQIPRMAFHRLVRKITQELTMSIDGEPVFRYQSAALEALQDAAESYLTALFEDSYLCTLHAKRVTLFVSDMVLCRRIRERTQVY